MKTPSDGLPFGSISKRKRQRRDDEPKGSPWPTTRQKYHAIFNFLSDHLVRALTELIIDRFSRWTLNERRLRKMMIFAVAPGSPLTSKFIIIFPFLAKWATIGVTHFNSFQLIQFIENSFVWSAASLLLASVKFLVSLRWNCDGKRLIGIDFLRNADWLWAFE